MARYPLMSKACGLCMMHAWMRGFYEFFGGPHGVFSILKAGHMPIAPSLPNNNRPHEYHIGRVPCKGVVAKPHIVMTAGSW